MITVLDQIKVLDSNPTATHLEKKKNSTLQGFQSSMHACDEMVIQHLFSLYLGINSKEPCWILFIELPFIFIVTGKIKSSSHLLP